MNSLVQVFRYELRRQGRRPAFLLVSIGIPIIALALFFGYRFYQQTRQGSGPSVPSISKRSPIGEARPAGVVDHSGLLTRSPFSNQLIFNTEEQAEAALNDNQISAYYVVAADYLESGRVDMYFAYSNIGSLDNSALRQMLIQGLVARSGKTIDPALIVRLQAKEPDFTIHTVNEAGGIKQAAGEGASFVLVYLFAMMLLFGAFTTSGYLMQSVIEEKESRMVEIILSSVRPGNLLAGKILALGLLGLIQMVLWGATAVYIIRQIIPTDPAMVGFTVTTGQLIVLFIYFVLGYLYFASIYASIGALSTSMREGPQLAAVVALPAAVPLWATSIFATAPDGPLAVVLSIFPPTAPLAMVMRTAITDVPFVQLAASMVLLALTVAFTMWLAGRVFRVNTLLSGQMPKLRDLPRLVRGNA